MLAIWTQVILSTAVAAQAFNISVWYSNSGERVISRVWYGDGQAYVGSVVPPEVSVAFNISSPGLDGFVPLGVHPDGNAAADVDGLSMPQYLAVNYTTGAEEPVYFVSDPADAGVTEDGGSVSTALWAAYEGILIPIDGYNSVAGIAFLGETSVEGTWVVRWNVGGQPTEKSKRLVTLMSRAPPGGW